VGTELDQVALQIQAYGGDYRTFQSLGLRPYSTPALGVKTTAAADDYVFVAGPTNSWSASYAPGVSFPARTAEFSTFKTRQTIVAPPQTNGKAVSNITGFLRLNHQGFYEPRNVTLYKSFSDPLIGSFALASYQPNGAWPYSTTLGQQAAYNYISNHGQCSQPAGCDPTSDVRSQYAQLLDSPNTVNNYKGWIAALSFPGPGHGFTVTQFRNVQTEVGNELSALTELSDYKTELDQFFTTSAIVNSLNLDSIANQIEHDLQIDTSKPTKKPEWQSVVDDIIAIGGPLAGAAAAGVAGPAGSAATTSGAALLALMVNDAAENSNDGQGTPLSATEQTEVAVSGLAAAAAANYSTYLSNVDHMLQRVATDANRLNHFYAAKTRLLQEGADPDATINTTHNLNSWALAWKREVYTRMIASSYQIMHWQYGSVNNNIANALCFYDYGDGGYGAPIVGTISSVAGVYPNATAFLPGQTLSSNYTVSTSEIYQYPNDIWWDFWGISLNGDYHLTCPRTYDYSTTDANLAKYQLFTPLSENEQGTVSVNQPLGIYQADLLNPRKTQIPVVNGNGAEAGNAADPYWTCAYCTIQQWVVPRPPVQFNPPGPPDTLY
jgi:hypothetical protein